MTRPFPFLARAHRLARDFLEPLEERVGIDKAGLAVWQFIARIVDVQALRLAKHEMLARSDALKAVPPEAPWLYRDLYQLDACDRENRITVAVPADAMECYQADGWFLSWQYELWARMMPEPLGPRPREAPRLEMIRPEDAALQIAGWTNARAGGEARS